MINKKKKQFCAELAISSPPQLASFVKPRLPVRKPRAFSSLITIDNAIPKTIGLAVSVIIPMFNAEKFIGECLDSLLEQTFQNFEVIVVDDCSTDNSVAVVEEYAPKFGERLTLTKTETNSGGGGYVPRNIGLKLARGEYVFFLDADDFIMLTALEILYDVAKKYEADVIYSSTYYKMLKPGNNLLYRDQVGKELIKSGKEDKATLTIDNQDKILNNLLMVGTEGNFRNPWSKFMRRDFLLENNIFFPDVVRLTTGGDFLWVINVYCHAKRFLRLPTTLYFHRAYNVDSNNRMKRAPKEQVSYWITAFAAFLKVLSKMISKNEVLQKTPAYALAAAKSHFNWCLNRTYEARKELTDQDIYTNLYHEFSKLDISSELMMPFFFSLINTDKKISEENLQTINKLNNDLSKLKKFSLNTYPAISVIIPMYNVEKYVGECLDSLLAQSFQNFELIIVDDGSTDSSCEVVESYMPKFNRRLNLFKMEENTGYPGELRNFGLSHAHGEYIYFMDSDDALTKTALEEMFLLAKDYDADVVYCERYYMSEGVGEDFVKNIRVADSRVQSPPYVNKPIFEPEDLSTRVQKIIKTRYWTGPVSKFVRHDLLDKHKIIFPSFKPSEDDIWTYGLVFFAKKFLRVPNMIYIRRMREDSIMGAVKTPQQTMNFWLAPILLGIKKLDELMSQHEFFQENPSYRYSVLEFFLKIKLHMSLKDLKEIDAYEVYSAIKTEFGQKLGKYDILIPILWATLYQEKSKPQIPIKFYRFLTARIDIKSISAGDFQILSSSDRIANIEKPSWFQKNGIGYSVTSLAGSLTLVAKATVSGKINLQLKGVWIPDPADKSKRIPYWIDYTNLVVNNKTIFNKLIPAWHDKPYRCSINAKADEEITIKVEWLPHMGDFIEQKILPPPPPPKVEPIPNKFKNYLTARIDINLLTTEGDFKIISSSDTKAKISQPSFMKEERIGYIITSLAGSLILVAKATVDGQLNLKLRGMSIPAPKDKSKRIPYWIDYTKLIVNDKKIFVTLKPAWHDKPYIHNMEVKADKEITIKVEWLPHMGDFIEQKILPPPPPKVEPIPNKFKNYLTARLDINLLTTEGDFKIISSSDDKAKIIQPSFMKEERIGYIVTSLAGSLTLVAKATVDGQLNLKLRGVYVSAPDDKSKAVPYWIDYTKLIMNNKTIFNKLTPAWHDKPYVYNMEVKADEEIIIKVEWQPHRSDT